MNARSSKYGWNGYKSCSQTCSWMTSHFSGGVRTSCGKIWYSLLNEVLRKSGFNLFFPELATRWFCSYIIKEYVYVEMKNIWLIRHGESQSNSGEKTTHPGTSILTERGLLQAECIKTYIQCRPDIIVHSPFKRALQSAQATINKFPDVIVDVWPVHEFIYLPDEKYLNTTQANRLAAVNNYWQECNPEQKNAVNAESFTEFIDRMEMIVKKLMNRHDHIIVFTHGHVIRAMIWKIITGTLKKDTIGMAQYRSLRNAIYIPNAAILKIRLDEQELQMSQLITSHIKPELST